MKDDEAFRLAQAQVEAEADPVSVTDIAPDGAEQLGRSDASPFNAAVVTILRRVCDAVEGAQDDADVLTVYLMLHGTKAKRRDLWRRARDPHRLYADFTDWLFETPAAELVTMLDDLAPQQSELDEVAAIETGADEDGEEGGPGGNAPGSR